MKRPLLLAILVAFPFAQAHGDEVHYEGERMAAGTYLSHVQVWQLELGPGESQNQTLAFDGGVPLKQDWFWLLRADIEGDVTTTLSQGHGVLQRWTWTSGSHVGTTRLPATDFATLTVANHGEENATVLLYYDQTCECTLKGIPLTSGSIFFNAAPRADLDVTMNFTLITAPVQAGLGPDDWHDAPVTVRASVLEFSDDGSTYTVTDSMEWRYDADASRCTHATPYFNQCPEFTYRSSGTGHQTVLLEVEHDQTGWGVQVRPILEWEEARGMPGFGFPATGVVVLGVMLIRSRSGA